MTPTTARPCTAIRGAFFLLALVATCTSVCAAEVTLDDHSRKTLRLQLALERAHFSPGILDAKPGPKLTRALAEFQKSRNLPATGLLDAHTASALELTDTPPTTTYTVSPADLASVTGPAPKTWPLKARAKSLGYETLHESLAERFHCSRELLTRLNPSVNFNTLKPNNTIAVPALESPSSFPTASRLEVNQLEKVIRVYDARDRLVALFHCSIAKDVAKRPAGDARVVTVAQDPTYHFDPRMWPEVKGVSQKLLIPAGPRNPVGKCWIGLSLRGYGIHGTPNPELIGKTGSHGCIRLANWDAQRLAKSVSPGTKVSFIKTPAAK